MQSSVPSAQHGSAWEVLGAFLRLGLSSFGGPIAHIGYFREEFVVRRRWLGEQAFADLVALCQFLPGPASSQVGFSIGLMRAGAAGALAAWAGFTLPSAAALVLFASGAAALDNVYGHAALHGLKLVAVAIIAQAVWGMARTLCPDRPRATIALVAALLLLSSNSSLTQILAIALGAALGAWLCRADAGMPASPLHIPIPKALGIASLSLFGALLLWSLWPDGQGHAATRIFAAFYRSGALVFGGGHVVLPLLRDAFVTPGWVSDEVFLAGYGAAQAVPGPLFTFAAYLGTVVNTPPHGVAGATLALVGIFLPGILILLGVLPFWGAIRLRSGVQAAMRGVNAAVVGILGAALYHPVWTGSVTSARDLAMALAGFVLLTSWRAPPLLIVAMLALAAVLFR